jgi:hypothetical protein
MSSNWLTDLKRLSERVDWLYNKVMCLLQNSTCGEPIDDDQNNIVVVIEIPCDELSGVGTEIQQVVEWMNAQNPPIVIDKKTNLILTVNCEPEPQLPKPFDVEEDLIKPCELPPSTNYNAVYYHNGSQQYPTLGDTIYTDSAGTILAANIGVSGSGALAYSTVVYDQLSGMSIPGWLVTDGNGILIEPGC